MWLSGHRVIEIIERRPLVQFGAGPVLIQLIVLAVLSMLVVVMH